MISDYDKSLQQMGEIKEKREEVGKQIQVEQDIKKIIRGHNDVFRKFYDLEEQFGVKFTIAIKAPNIIEQGEIRARTESYLKGTGYLAPEPVIRQFNLLSSIQVCGVEIPEVLKDPENIYNPAILGVVADDFIEWLDSFRL